MFFPNEFFSHMNPKIAPLFHSEKPVWTALQLLEEYLLSLKLGNIEVEIPNGSFLVDSHLISIGKGTVVEPGAYIRGPCVIGENCVIRHGAYIRSTLLAGDGCVIGHDTEVKNAIFFDKAHAAHFSYIGDTVLGYAVNMGAGAICSNLKLDSSNVTVFFDGRKIDTGLRKFGAIIGDESRVGCNAVLNPGTIMGTQVLCHPCLNVGGYIPPKSLLKAETKFTITSRKFL